MAPRRTTPTVIIGLTGGVGAGKSTAERIFRRGRVPTADADRWAHEVLDGDAVAQRRIAAYFRVRCGLDVRKANGAINRAAVADRVFADTAALRFIESVVHPRVKARGAAWCARQRRSGVPLAVLVAPLLFESGMDAQVDYVVALAVPVKDRCRRLGASRGWTVSEARARMRHQMAEAARVRRADFVINNTGTPAQLAAALKSLREKLRLRAARGAGKQHQ